MITFDKIDELIWESRKPSKNLFLKNLYKINGEREPHLYYMFLHNLVKYLKPKVCLEIGTWNGVASVHMALANADTKVIGLDINHLTHDFDINNFYFIQGDATDKKVFNKVKAFGKIDIVYQDSSHHYNPSVKEFEMYSPLVRKGGLWICDDITDNFYDEGGSMPEYFAKIPQLYNGGGVKQKLYDNLHKGNRQGINILL